MVDHLIETKCDPKGFTPHIGVAAKIMRPRLNSIHRKMYEEIQSREPPKLRSHIEYATQCSERMYSAMKRERRHEVPARTRLLQHPNILKYEVRQEMLNLIENQQAEQKIHVDCHDIPL